MKYLINNSTDPYFNLAFDEYCLENIQSEDLISSSGGTARQ